MVDKGIVLAFPLREEDRAKLRRFVPTAKMPAIYPNSTEKPCDECGMRLAVGPRSAAMLTMQDLRLLCPICAVRASGGDEINITSLGNPDSKPETPGTH